MTLLDGRAEHSRSRPQPWPSVIQGRPGTAQLTQGWRGCSARRRDGAPKSWRLRRPREQPWGTRAHTGVALLSTRPPLRGSPQRAQPETRARGPLAEVRTAQRCPELPVPSCQTLRPQRRKAALRPQDATRQGRGWEEQTGHQGRRRSLGLLHTAQGWENGCECPKRTCQAQQPRVPSSP